MASSTPYIEITEKLYDMLVDGETKAIISANIEDDLWLQLKTEDENDTVLHIAAGAGKDQVIDYILPKSKDIIKLKNVEGDLAFHSAAKEGHLSAIKALTKWSNYDNIGFEVKISKELLGERNKEGDTALHIALKERREDISWHLVNEYGAATFMLNNHKICPLYLAIKERYGALVNFMINFMKMEDQLASLDFAKLLEGKSIIHAAIEAKKLDILKVILGNHKNLIKSIDEEGQTPLSYAASKGYLEGVQYLLKEFPRCEFERNKDKDGSFTIHRAVSRGDIKVIRKLHRSSSLLNSKRQNILHIAASKGHDEVVSYLLKLQTAEQFIDQKDIHGHTPLSLAIKESHKAVIDVLTREPPLTANTVEAPIERLGESIVNIGHHLYMLAFEREKEGNLDHVWEFLKSETDNGSFLHVAARVGEAELINDIIPKSKDLIKWQNSAGDLAFHSAAKAGYLNALKALTNWQKYDIQGVGNLDKYRSLLGRKNMEGDTALHIALRNKHHEMAKHLFNEYGEACYELNGNKISPLYLAIKAGYGELVKNMISYITKHDLLDPLFSFLVGKSIVHAAIEAKNKEMLEEILENHKELIESDDSKGRTPLSYAAFEGYLEGVQYLLNAFPESAYKCDKDKFLPIHKAAIGGHIEIIEHLWSTMRLLNGQGQNILHVAAGIGKFKLVSYLLKKHEAEQLINQRDKDGNTPLHLAAKYLHPRVVYILSIDKRVSLDVQNNDGCTPLDVAKSRQGGTIDGFLTWATLTYASPNESSKTKELETEENAHENGSKKAHEKENTHEIPGEKGHEKENTHVVQNQKGRHEQEKDKFTGSNLVVATLVATVTFAAGFTLPGGYFQNNPNIGMAVLAREWAFHVFVISNTVAMYSSVLAVMIFFYTQINRDTNKMILLSINIGMPMLRLALTMMSVTFMMGIFLVLKTQPQLSYVILFIGSVSLVMMQVFFPIYCPYRHISNRFGRFLVYCRLRILIRVFENLKP